MIFIFKTTQRQTKVNSLDNKVRGIRTKEKSYKNFTIRKSFHVAKPTISSDILVGVDALAIEDVGGEYIK